MIRYILVLIATIVCKQMSYAQKPDSVYFTTGIKIGEVTDSSAVILTRLCESTEPVEVYQDQKGAPFSSPIDFDNDMPIHKMEGAVIGSGGQVKISLVSEDTAINLPWQYVSTYKDYTIKRQLTGLYPNTQYKLAIKGRKSEGMPETEIRGGLKTAVSNDEISPVRFTVSTCQYFWSFDDSVRGFKIYDIMASLEPDFHLQTGDYVYYDKPGPMAYNVALARHKWHAMNSWPSLVDFYGNVPVYQLKDDHDLLDDDATPVSPPFGELTVEDGIHIWYEQVPIVGKSYRTFRWGKDVQIWLVEGREFRSDNADPDGEDKTIWGETQISWFTNTVESSDATFKVLISATPVVGPDRAKGKTDNHANKSFATEGNWLRNYLASQNIIVINGDRHWQYVSKDGKTGLMEFSSGPSSDSHAQGWNPKDVRPEHRFLRVKGGFLCVEAQRKNGVPTLTFSHYDVDGKEVHKEIFTQKK